MAEKVYYAIGDVHGMARKLARLHEAIEKDVDATGRESAIVHLGDYVDRGPESRRVIEMIIALKERLVRKSVAVHALRGNHEQMMIDAYERRRRDSENLWRFNGGDETIESYGARPDDGDWRDKVGARHVAWLKSLPHSLADEEAGLFFVHAGIEPARFPEHDEEVYLWTRSARFFDTSSWPDRPELAGLRVIHGHTPTDDDCPHADTRRINVDTGAVFGGPLTCVVLAPGETPRFLFA